MTARERVLASRLVERAARNRELAKELGLDCNLNRVPTDVQQSKKQK